MPNLLTANLLGRARVFAESQMVTPCVIKKNTLAADGLGGSTPTVSTVATTVCFIGAMGSSAVEREIAQRLSGSILKKLHLPYDATLHTDYWIEADGISYYIEGIITSDADIEQQVICRVTT